jgi:hypothetical protein
MSENLSEIKLVLGEEITRAAGERENALKFHKFQIDTISRLGADVEVVRSRQIILCR